MKKNQTAKLRFKLNAARRRADRSHRPKGGGASGIINPIYLKPNPQLKGVSPDLDTPRIQAPAKLDLYSKDNCEIFSEFLLRLRQASKYNTRIIISFRHTHRITAAAALRLVAEVDHLLKIHPDLSFGCAVPAKRSGRKYRESYRVIESILQQIGFFKKIGQVERAPAKRPDVVMWNNLSGSLADGSLAAGLLNSLPDSITKQSKAQLYKGAIEAMANSVDHAYPENSEGEEEAENRWWMLVGVREDSITLIICDLGVGIPVTLPAKHPPSLLESIFSKFRIFGHSDAEMIQASTFIKRTRTKLTHRGKGGADIRSITEHFPGALLSIRSNRGCYVVAGKDYEGHLPKGYRKLAEADWPEWSESYRGSICGTLIEWTVSLKELEK